MLFYDLSRIKSKTLAEGVKIKAVPGEKMTMTIFYLSPGAGVPEHAHPHEQIGTVLKGSMEFIIGEERKIVKKGDAWSIPANMLHKGRCLHEETELIEVFSPPREAYVGK